MHNTFNLIFNANNFQIFDTKYCSNISLFAIKKSRHLLNKLMTVFGALTEYICSFGFLSYLCLDNAKGSYSCRVKDFEGDKIFLLKFKLCI